MATLSYDLAFLETGTPDLKDYLLSKELYWPIGGRPPKGEGRFPRFTLGWLLLSLKRASARVHGSPDQSTVDAYSALVDEIRDQWKSAWENKAAKEFNSRLKLWGQYINDVRKAPKESNERYGYEVNRRVLLQILLGETSLIGKQPLDLLRAQDIFVRGKLRSGLFLWEADLKEAFPQGEYWFLYGSLTP